MTLSNLFMTGTVMALASQGCMTTEYLSSIHDLDSSQTVFVRTRSGGEYSVAPRNFGKNGSLIAPDGTVFPADSLESLRISRLDGGKTALTAVAIAAGIYATVRFVEVVKTMIEVSPPQVAPRWPFF